MNDSLFLLCGHSYSTLRIWPLFCPRPPAVCQSNLQGPSQPHRSMWQDTCGGRSNCTSAPSHDTCPRVRGVDTSDDTRWQVEPVVHYRLGPASTAGMDTHLSESPSSNDPHRPQSELHSQHPEIEGHRYLCGGSIGLYHHLSNCFPEQYIHLHPPSETFQDLIYSVLFRLEQYSTAGSHLHDDCRRSTEK